MRLIDAQGLMVQIPYEELNARMVISNAPTVDAVPVVRCKDCMYLEPSLNSDWSWCCYFDSKVRGDDFCSHGERREDAKTN